MNKLLNSIVLNKLDIKKIKDLVNQISACPIKTPNDFCNQSKQLSHFLPQDIKTKIAGLQNTENKTMLISNIPIMEYETAIQSTEYPTELYKTQSLFVNAIPYIDMISYEAESNGKLFQNIFPVKSMADKQTSLSSTELEIHTEQAFSRLRPDILCLACLRGDINAMTYILPINAILKNLSDADIMLSRQSLWTFGVDLSFKINGNEFIHGDMRGPFPIITGNVEDPLLRFDQDLIMGITDPATALVKKIIDIYYEHRVSYNLTPGDLLLIDNNRAIHGRSAFTPKYDGYDRYLTRCFGIYHYKYIKSEYARSDNGRIISAIHS